ncbi:MAG: hypothetical protein IPL26_30150 [Leptospiraceae bacterium]|nr:hypothetical protein [Leptospiraceae bacterium]
MGKNNSGFDDMIVWGLGIFALTKIFGKDKDLPVSETNILNHQVYRYTELPLIVTLFQKDFCKDNQGNVSKTPCRGATQLSFYIEAYNPERSSDGRYTIQTKVFEVVVRTFINDDKDLKWNKIEDFSFYYVKNKEYTINDVDLNFYTKEGTVYHEKLHRRVAKDTLGEFRDEIIEKVANIKSVTPKGAFDEWSKIVLEYKHKIELKFYDDADHDRIRVDTWDYYRILYEGIQ